MSIMFTQVAKQFPALTINTIAGMFVAAAKDPFRFSEVLSPFARWLFNLGLFEMSVINDYEVGYVLSKRGRKLVEQIPNKDKLEVPLRALSVDDHMRLQTAAATAVGMFARSELSRRAPAPPRPAEAHGIRELACAVLSLKVKGSKLDAIEGAVVSEALDRAKGNKTQGARIVGMNRKAFGRRIRRYKKGAPGPLFGHR